MRRIALLALAAAVAAVLAVPAAQAKPWPTTISLPNGWLPEGIAIGKGHVFYAGSRANGAVYAGDLRTGQAISPTPLVPGVAGRVATGLKESHGMLFVSGANTGKAWVFDAKTGAQLREYQLVPAATSSFINDVVVTHDAAWFTDSRDDVLYRVALGKGHQPAAAATQLQLTGDFQLGAPNQFNLNGIEATPNGKTLLAIQSFNGKLYAIDARTGAAKLVDVGGANLTNGDGILLHGHTLYVVRNQNNEIAVLDMSHDFTSGKLVRTITDPAFDVPTTIAEHGNRLYAVNARFTTPPTPATTYTIVQVRR
jgi:outer membrane protein assembly factor BamB